MKRILLPVICVFSVLSACTSNEGQIKEQALKVGQQKFDAMVQKEADEALKESPLLHQAYIQFLNGTSEVAVEELKFHGDNEAVISLVMKTYSTSLRQTVLEVAQKVPPSKSRRFNFGEAMALIAQQKGQKQDVESQPLTVLRFHKASNQWVLQN